MTHMSGYETDDRKLRIEGLHGEPDVVISCIIGTTRVELVFTRVWGEDNAPIMTRWFRAGKDDGFATSDDAEKKDQDNLVIRLAGWADKKLDELWIEWHRERGNEDWKPPPRKWRYHRGQLVSVADMPQSLFEGKPEPIDWADEVARGMVIQAFEMGKIFSLNPQFPDGIAWGLACSLAPELRGFKADLRQQNAGKKDSLSRKIRKEILDPTNLAECCREHAGKLDKRGWTAEAAVLREAATILEEDC